MIQRIQTVFLLLTALLMGATVLCPLLSIENVSTSQTVIFHSCGIGNDYPTWGVLAFAALSSVLAFVNMFLYKKRKLQINIGWLAALFIVIFYITGMVYLNAFLDKTDSACNITAQYGVILPVVALVLDLLAVSRIKKDEKLVKSLDRIR